MKKDILKLLTCGSVDDGKSTLIGHLLYDAKLLYADQEQALLLESSAAKSDGSLDYSLLLDGLVAEREQGITIDAAYRFFTTKRRSFIVADTPGHEQYTRNMAVGASFAELALMLVNAQTGLLTQTKRHLRIARLVGIRHVLFAVNKMDLVDYAEDVFKKIEADILAFAGPLAFDSLTVLPVSAKLGDNLTSPSQKMPWYSGPTLLSFLEEVDIPKRSEEGTILPVQRVARDEEGRRFYQGTVESGRLALGDTVTVYPSTLTATVAAIRSAGVNTDHAEKGEAVAVAFSEERDISRGDVIACGTNLTASSLFEASLLWMDETPLVEGKRYRIKLATQERGATAMRLKYKEDIDTGLKEAAKQLEKNELGRVDFAVSPDLVLDSFDRHPSLGRFLVIDRLTNHTAGCGVIHYPLRRAHNLIPQETDITRKIRAKMLGQTPKTFWFTGLSGSGKSALANALEKELAAMGRHTMLLDGDNIRLGLNNNLGFTKEDRVENIRRVAEAAKLLNDAGLIVLVSLISPFEDDREAARQIIGEGSFVEIYVSTPLEECERRDPKGHYKKARSGEIPNFTGINSPYEPPAKADIEIDTTGLDVADALRRLMEDQAFPPLSE